MDTYDHILDLKTRVQRLELILAHAPKPIMEHISITESDNWCETHYQKYNKDEGCIDCTLKISIGK